MIAGFPSFQRSMSQRVGLIPSRRVDIHSYSLLSIWSGNLNCTSVSVSTIKLSSYALIYIGSGSLLFNNTNISSVVPGSGNGSVIELTSMNADLTLSGMTLSSCNASSGSGG